ncbi:hypothetical protein BGZ99_007038, partial [Dissophora globulifera]
MFAKSSKFIAPLVVALIACMTVEANRWCNCSDPVGLTPDEICSAAGGYATGGNCLITSSNPPTNGNEGTFDTLCRKVDPHAPVSPGVPFCWTA